VPGCDENQMKDYCQQHAFDAWFETSAKENINIEEAARFLIARVSIDNTSEGRGYAFPLVYLFICLSLHCNRSCLFVGVFVGLLPR